MALTPDLHLDHKLLKQDFQKQDNIFNHIPLTNNVHTHAHTRFSEKCFVLL